MELFTQKVVTKLSKIWVWDPGSEIRDPGSGINLFRIPDPGSRGQKGPNPGSRIRIRNTVCTRVSVLYILLAIVRMRTWSRPWSLIDPSRWVIITFWSAIAIICVYQCFVGALFIWYGTESSILGWTPIRIQSGSRVLMTNNWREKNYSTAKKSLLFLDQKLQFTYP